MTAQNLDTRIALPSVLVQVLLFGAVDRMVFPRLPACVLLTYVKIDLSQKSFKIAQNRSIYFN